MTGASFTTGSQVPTEVRCLPPMETERECSLDLRLHSKEMFARSLKKIFLGCKAEQEASIAFKSIVILSGTFLAVQWLGFCASAAGHTGRSLVREARSCMQIMVQCVRACSLTQSYPTLCDPLDCSPPRLLYP